MAENVTGHWDRPFTSRVEALRRAGQRYQDLAAGCGHVRSSAWFNNLVKYGAWYVGPPTRDAWQGLATLLRIDVTHVRTLIAHEWYGVRPSQVSDRVGGLAGHLDALCEDDAVLVGELVRRLSANGDALDDPIFGMTFAEDGPTAPQTGGR
jgi:hypothetical protein